MLPTRMLSGDPSSMFVMTSLNISFLSLNVEALRLS